MFLKVIINEFNTDCEVKNKQKYQLEISALKQGMVGFVQHLKYFVFNTYKITRRNKDGQVKTLINSRYVRS